MHIAPILAALRRNKTGAVLIGLQIALTLAIVCNALFIIQQRLEHLSRPTGIDEPDLFIFGNQLVGTDAAEVPGRIAADEQTIRETPGVAEVYRTNSVPLSGDGWNTGIVLSHDQTRPSSQAAVYFADEHTLATLGLRLVEGRNFTADEVKPFGDNDILTPAVVIITRELAQRLFPNGSALGKAVYLSDKAPPSTIVGVVESLQTPFVTKRFDEYAHSSTLVPLQPQRDAWFVVRARPGQLAAVMKAVPERLYAQNRMRVIEDLRSFAELRQKAYRSDRGMALLMAIVCGALLLVTAAGIVGLASFWVGQRQRQIGIRRALGATRTDILRYFQLENLLIGGGGSVIGVLAAVGLNLWLVTQYEMPRVPVPDVLIAAAAVLGLGQLAVLQPSLRASRVPPVIATRSV